MSKAKITKIFENDTAKEKFEHALKISKGCSAFDLKDHFISEEMMDDWFKEYQGVYE